MKSLRDINLKGPVVVAIATVIVTTCLNQGGVQIIEKVKSVNDANTWDDELDEVKQVVEPIVKSTSSLAVDRKISLLNQKKAILSRIAATPEEDRTVDQRDLYVELTKDIKSLEKEVKVLEEVQALPVFPEEPRG